MIKGLINSLTGKVHILNIDNTFTLCSLHIKNLDKIGEVDISQVSCKRCLDKYEKYKHRYDI